MNACNVCPGAKVVPVTSGSKKLNDAINEAMRDWVTNVRDTHYLIGSAIGPHPFPTIVRDFQSVMGKEARAQMLGDLIRDLFLILPGGLIFEPLSPYRVGRVSS